MARLAVAVAGMTRRAKRNGGRRKARSRGTPAAKSPPFARTEAERLMRKALLAELEDRRGSPP